MLQRLVKLKGPSNLYQLLKVWLEAGLSDSTTKPVPQPLSESIRRILQLLTILPVDLEAIKTSYIGHFVRLIKEGKSASLVARDSDVIAKASVVYDKWKRASDSARAASGAASGSSTASAKKAGSKRTASDKGDIEIVESDDDEKRALKRAKKDKKDKKERQDEPGQSKAKKDSAGSTSKYTTLHSTSWRLEDWHVSLSDYGSKALRIRSCHVGTPGTTYPSEACTACCHDEQCAAVMLQAKLPRSVVSAGRSSHSNYLRLQGDGADALL